MKKNYHSRPLRFNRKVLAASASVTRQKNTIHSITEVDISTPRTLIKNHFEKTGEKLSFTAYIIACLAKVLKDHPDMNSFIKRNRLILLDDLTISVLIEREISGEKIPEPVGIKEVQEKSFLEIHQEIREAQKMQSDQLGTLSGSDFIRFIPKFLLKTFIRIADKNIKMAVKYGKVAVTAVGMFSREPLWFIPHGSATVLLTIGSINQKVMEVDGEFVSREHLCITVSFDHNIVDGAPAARFMEELCGEIKGGEVLRL